MSKPILILVATMSGAAELTADELSIALEERGREVRVQGWEKASLATFSAGAVILICTSTYGKGEVPDNAKLLVAALERERPELAGVLYGVVGLGDHTHIGTVCQGGITFDELLTALGATRIGERCLHDGAHGGLPEDTALEWLPRWLAALEAAGV